MKFDNKTVSIIEFIILRVLSSVFNYQKLFIASINGLLGYLSKNIVKLIEEQENNEDLDEKT